MNIKGLDLQEVSRMLEPYLTAHFQDLKLKYLGQCLFSESYRLDFTEVRNVIPEKYHGLFNGNEWFNGASGSVEFESINDDELYEYTLMLLTSKNYSEALIFCTQEVDSKGDYKIVMIKDFIESTSFCNGANYLD